MATETHRKLSSAGHCPRQQHPHNYSIEPRNHHCNNSNTFNNLAKHKRYPISHPTVVWCILLALSTTLGFALDRADCLNEQVNNKNGVFVVKQAATTSNKISKQLFHDYFDRLTVHVKENTPIGTKLTDIQPKYNESHVYNQQDKNDRVQYAIIGGIDQYSFTLREYTENKVELVNEIQFDYESGKKLYQILIRATSLYLRYDVEVDVLVVDENDNRPQLEDFSIVFNNYKNNFPTGPVGRVPAIDLDQDDVLRYRVLSGNNAQLIYVNETNGDIQLSPWLNSNVPLKAVMDIAVSDGPNEAVAKLFLTVNLVTETMLHNSVVLHLDGLSRDDFLSKRYDIFQSQMARILGSSSPNYIVVFDVDETWHVESVGTTAAAASPLSPAYKSQFPLVNSTSVSINVSFSARADGNDVEAYLSSQYIEERVFLSRNQLAQSLEVQVAPFQDNMCLQEPCQNYQECQATYKFDKAPRTFYTNRNMIFRPIKATQSFACTCPQSYTGMKHKSECNLQINPCFSNPCLNGGVCHRHESGYSCECKSSEFLGPRCEFSFANSTCQSIAHKQSTIGGGSGLLDTSSNPLISSNQILDSSSLDSLQYTKQQQQQAAATMCSGKSRCVNLNKSHYYPGKPTSSLGGGGFICQGCPYPQWSNELCQLRARSFDKNSFLTLPSLRRRHRFHLMFQFSTVQSDALLLYNGRYNDKHDFIALEIVNSKLKFSYSLGVNSGVESVSLSSVPVSDGNWHKVAIDYRDRNVTLIVDDCDPIIDEALARIPGSSTRRCSNSSTFAPLDSSAVAALASGQDYKMLDLTSPMQLGALATYLTMTNEQRVSNQGGFAGCISDFYIDHQLVDLSVPIQDFGTQPGCLERRTYCQQHSCNGFPCQDSLGSARCQCGEDRMGKSCEIYMSNERVRKFSGNSYLAISHIDQTVPAQWQISMHFRTINPNGILMKLALGDANHESSVLVELSNGGLKLSHRSASAMLTKIALDDGEWHFVELVWTGDSTLLQLDYNPNLSVQSQEFGNIIGQTIKHIIVGSSSARSISSSASSSSSAVGSSSSGGVNSLVDGLQPPQQQPTASALQSEPLASAEFTTGSTQSPEDLSSVYLYGATNSSQSFVGCIYGLNISDTIDWLLAPSEERNIERGCPVVDVCETNPCPMNSRCIRRGLSQRKCLCNQGFVGDQCLPVCDLSPCQGENSKCVPALKPTELGAEQLVSKPTQPESWSATTAANAGPSSQYTCECESLRSGKNCENQLSAKCPSNWWGRPTSGNSSMCGPCNCDESRGFDGDCDKTTGQCYCKPSHYQPLNSDYCLACDCYLVGSLSSSCNQTSGQCKCRPGVVGRRCDTCASPYAEVTLRGCEVIYDACPKTYSDGVWWDKTQLDRMVKTQCPPSTSTGTATRFCHKTEGWQKANLFDCVSNTFADLYTQYLFLEDNKFQMTTSLAMKIASNLKAALNETISSPSLQLYGSDMYISFRLIHHLIQHETHQSGLNLTHRQDRMYIRNIVESVSYILDPAFAENLPEIAARSPDGGFEHLLRLFDSYGKVLIESQSDTFTQPFEISAKYFTFGMDTLSTDQLWDLSKWSTGSSSSSSMLGNQQLGPSLGGIYPSSPPYATDPFDQFSSSSSLDGRPMGSSSSRHGEQHPGHFNSDGVSVYLDYSAASSRDPSSPSVVIPKYDNNPSSSADSAADSSPTKIFIPLRTLRIKNPQDLFATGARSRAKRDELVIPDFNQNVRQKPALVVYSIYKSLGPMLPNDYDNSVQNRLGVLATANSPVVWLTMRAANSTEMMGKHVQPKITYMLKMMEPSGRTRPQCAIWDFVSPAATTLGKNLSSNSLAYGIKQTGRFTTKGCEIKGIHPNHRLRYKFDYVNCSCDHLGAVTVLMDSAVNFDYLTNEETNFKDLAIMISLLLSMILLLSTMFVLSCIRGHSIKSNSNSINKNLVFILLVIELMIFYTVYSRSSLNQHEYQCKLVAIFLHYFSISLFSWLLVNAIHFYRMLTELRDINHGPMKFYYVLGYAVPAFFVSIAVGLRIEQFGNYLFCWLSIHEPIIWSMFGPISVLSVFIMLLFGLALSRSLPIKEDLTGAELIKSHMLINITKTPLIGIFWLITVYAVNESLMDYVYVFPIVTVFKSITLFVLLCIIDKYIRYNLYVSWLRFKGEKIPFVEPEYSYSNGTQSQWFSSMGGGGLGLPNPLAYGKDQTSAAHLYSGNGQVMTPGFQSSCTDIFRPELLAFSAASTTSRSSASGTSSSVAYRDHYGRHRAAKKSHRMDDNEEDDDEYDDNNNAGHYGRAGRSGTRGHRRRQKNKSHRKHHHHKHHHHHHHNHRSHQHRGQEDDDDLHDHDSHENKHDSHHHHHHHHHRSAADYGHHGGGRTRRHGRSGGHNHYAERTGSEHHSHQQQKQQLLASQGDIGAANQNDGLASSHSSDADDVSTLPKTKHSYGTEGNQATETGAMTSLAQTQLVSEDQQQTVPMELLSPSSGTQQQQDNLDGNENTSESNNEPLVAHTST